MKCASLPALKTHLLPVINRLSSTNKAVRYGKLIQKQDDSHEIRLNSIVMEYADDGDVF
jgi:hypothetical protein